MMSARTGHRTYTPTFLLSDAELMVTHFNRHSRWLDEIWYFDAEVPGKRTYSLNWRLGCSQERWRTSRWQKLLADARRFLCSVQDQSMGVNDIAGPTIAGLGCKTRFLMHWMYGEGYSAFSEIDPQVFNDYKDYTLSILHEEESNSRTMQTIASYLDVPKKLHAQGALFERFPRLKLKTDPLQGRTAHSLCREMKLKGKGRVLPVPDEVANPVLLEAMKWIDDYSDSIIEAVDLQNYFFKKSNGWKSHNYGYFVNQGICGTKFKSTADGSEWRSPLLSTLAHRTETEAGDRVVLQNPLQQLADIFEDLVGACTTVLHGTVGFRSSEGASLLVEPMLKNGMPYCVDIRPSQIGLNEVFFIKGLLKKGRRKVVECEWVAGVRPVGTTHLPPPIRAILVLTRLFSFWRKSSGLPSLLLSVKSGGGFHRKKENVKAASYSNLVKLENRFISRNVSIPEKYRSWHVNRAQWRKKFSQDIVRSDPDLMPVLRLHFKQMSHHMIESAYFGSDAALLKLIDDEAVQQSAHAIADLIFGEETSYGKAAEILAEQIKTRVFAVSDRQARIAIITEELANEGLRTWGGSHGDCLFRWETALCHVRANKGVVDRLATRPNEQERCPNTCSGCSNLVISKRHLNFWIRRYESKICDHRSLWEAGEFVVAERAHQEMMAAKSVLLALGYENGLSEKESEHG